MDGPGGAVGIVGAAGQDDQYIVSHFVYLSFVEFVIFGTMEPALLMNT
jgi:hypothetical protein